MKTINFKHSIIFFNLCILVSPIYQTTNYTLIIFCLFLILIIGISHGALDNIKGAKLLNLFGYKASKLLGNDKITYLGNEYANSDYIKELVRGG